MALGRLNSDSKIAVGYLSLCVTHVSSDLCLVSHSDSMTLRMTGAIFIIFI